MTEFDAVMIFDNKKQIEIANEVSIWLTRLDSYDHLEKEDIACGTLVSAVKYWVHARYSTNRRQFGEKDKEELIKFISDLVDTQMNTMRIAQSLAH